ncbi:hypothetical protein COV17_03670 [Candidatus Woesearchaeota archaeon CG10_big_fil_rev_8_21_14_0_10_36_11]|nr:MAG: hypothetical protein COV17_03670 [Candidatus Woesearchaeota archaeon CG10_big_fil_rev_8_21_14_0_10_36_11]
MDPELRLSYMKYVARTAGGLINEALGRGLKVNYKNDGSIVTSADLRVRDFVREAFTREFSECGLLTEESEDSLERLTKKGVIIVDEVDGSNELRKGGSDFSFQCAYVENGIPTIGLICEPHKNRMYFALKGGKAYLVERETQPIELPSLERVAWENVLVGHHRNGRDHRRLYRLLGIPENRIVTSGSMGTRMVQAATRDIHLYVSFTRRLKEWDIAAGQVLLESLGFSVTDVYGKQLEYNKRNPITQNGILVVHPDIKRVTLKKLSSCYDQVLF